MSTDDEFPVAGTTHEMFAWLFRKAIAEPAQPEIPLEEMKHVIAEEGDRGLVMFGHAMLHQVLELGIRGIFVLDDKDKKDLEVARYLFSLGTSPFSSFLTRTEFAYASGIISLELRRSLNAERKLRNYMAHPPGHEIEELSLSRVNDLINLLPSHARNAVEEAYKKFFPDIEKLQGTLEQVNKDFASEAMMPTTKIRMGVALLRLGRMLSSARVRYLFFVLYASLEIIKGADQRAKNPVKKP
jgi:hypothetical protein